jgi:hypothetical protein
MRQMWDRVRPTTTQQRFLWWCGVLLLASGAVHALVAAIDGAPWAGSVSWRKPVVFGLSFGVLACSTAWVLRELPYRRRWGWVPAGLLGGGAVAEVAMITMQRWRGEASHFNAGTAFDEAIWAAMSRIVLLVALAVLMLLIWSLIEFAGGTAARIAVIAGLVGILASGYIGFGMAAQGEAVVEATGQVPEELLFGAAGSPKLAHALGMHALQVLAALVVVRARRTPVWLMLVATGGYAAVFGAVTAAAYAGRPWITPGPVPAVVAAIGLAALAFSAGWLLTRAARRDEVIR